MRKGQSDSLTLLDLILFVASVTAVGTAVIVEMGWVRCRISCLFQQTDSVGAGRMQGWVSEDLGEDLGVTQACGIGGEDHDLVLR